LLVLKVSMAIGSMSTAHCVTRLALPRFPSMKESPPVVGHGLASRLPDC
jgi:hypothetical protein